MPLKGNLSDYGETKGPQKSNLFDQKWNTSFSHGSLSDRGGTKRP